MSICRKCNKNKSFANQLCRICEWEEWALYGMEDEPQEIKDRLLESMRDSISYQGALIGQALLETWIEVYGELSRWIHGNNPSE